jgi:hypothetical protein
VGLASYSSVRLVVFDASTRRLLKTIDTLGRQLPRHDSTTKIPWASSNRFRSFIQYCEISLIHE